MLRYEPEVALSVRKACEACTRCGHNHTVPFLSIRGVEPSALVVGCSWQGTFNELATCVRTSCTQEEAVSVQLLERLSPCVAYLSLPLSCTVDTYCSGDSPETPPPMTISRKDTRIHLNPRQPRMMFHLFLGREWTILLQQQKSKVAGQQTQSTWMIF